METLAMLLLAAPDAKTSFPIDWRVAVLLGLLVPAMRIRPDHPRWFVWLLRSCAAILLVWIINDCLAYWHPRGWPVPAIPKTVGDYAVPAIYVVLYVYFVRSARKATRSIRVARDRAAGVIWKMRSRLVTERKNVSTASATIADIQQQIVVERKNASTALADMQQQLVAAKEKLLPSCKASVFIGIRDQISYATVELSRLIEVARTPSSHDRWMNEMTTAIMAPFGRLPLKECSDLGLVVVLKHLEAASNEYVKNVHPYMPEFNLDDIESNLLPSLRKSLFSLELARVALLENVIAIVTPKATEAQTS